MMSFVGKSARLVVASFPSLVFLTFLLIAAPVYAQILNSISPGVPQNSFTGATLATSTGTAYAIPQGRGIILTWQLSYAVAPTSITVLLEGSLNNIAWFTLDTSTNTAGEIRYLGPTSPQFIRARISAVNAGAGSGLTVIFNILAFNNPTVSTSGTVVGSLDVNRNAIATTSTDGLTLSNNTASTAAIPVQQSPRLRLRSNVWNTTATATNNTNDWFIESVPVSGTTPSGLLKFGSSVNGAAATFPMTLTSAGILTALSNIQAGGAVLSANSSSIGATDRTRITWPADGQANILNNAATAGIGIDVTTDGTFKCRNRAHTGDCEFTAGNITGATLVATTNINLGATGLLSFTTRTRQTSPADGQLNIINSAQTIGSQIKVDALPTAGTCGTSPTVTAGSTPFSGSINVGTATPASCIVIFGGTAFPSAPFCTANVVTSTAGNARSIGVLSTTTQVTLTPATNFVDSSIVAWHCISSK